MRDWAKELRSWVDFDYQLGGFVESFPDGTRIYYPYYFITGRGYIIETRAQEKNVIKERRKFVRRINKLLIAFILLLIFVMAIAAKNRLNLDIYAISSLFLVLAIVGYFDFQSIAKITGKMPVVNRRLSYARRLEIHSRSVPKYSDYIVYISAPCLFMFSLVGLIHVDGVGSFFAFLTLLILSPLSIWVSFQIAKARERDQLRTAFESVHSNHSQDQRSDST